MVDCSLIIKNGKCIELKNSDNTQSIKLKNNEGILETSTNGTFAPLLKTFKSIGFDYFYKHINTDIPVSKTDQNDQGSTTPIIHDLESSHPSNSVFIDQPKTQNNYFLSLTGAEIGKFQYKGSAIHGNIIARICLATKDDQTNLYSIYIAKNGTEIINNALSYQKIEEDYFSSGALYLSVNTELQNDDTLEIHISHVVSNNQTNDTTNTQIIALQFSFLGHLME